MHLYNNDIKRATKYQADSTVRTASEKRLDRRIRQDMHALNQFESQLFEVKPLIKQVKVESVRESPSQPKQITPVVPIEVVNKLFKLCENQTKTPKALQLMARFFDSAQVDKLNQTDLISTVTRLFDLNINKTGPLGLGKCTKEISQIVDRVLQIQTLSKEQLEVIQTIRHYWQILVVLYSDDSFNFSKAVTDLYKEIEELKVNKIDLDNYSDLYELKQAIKQEEAEEIQISYTEEHGLYLRRILVFKLVMKLFQLGVNWRKPSIDHFMRKFNNNQREVLLHPKQKRAFEQKYLEYQNMRIKNTLEKQKIDMLDSGIKSNPVQAGHQVKDARSQRIVSVGYDKWVGRQF